MLGQKHQQGYHLKFFKVQKGFSSFDLGKNRQGHRQKTQYFSTVAEAFDETEEGSQTTIKGLLSGSKVDLTHCLFRLPTRPDNDGTLHLDRCSRAPNLSNERFTLSCRLPLQSIGDDRDGTD